MFSQINQRGLFWEKEQTYHRMYRTTESSTVPQIVFMVILIINNYISIVNSEAAANPKSFTDDPFIDDEKFMEKGIKLYFR